VGGGTHRRRATFDRCFVRGGWFFVYSFVVLFLSCRVFYFSCCVLVCVTCFSSYLVPRLLQVAAVCAAELGLVITSGAEGAICWWDAAGRQARVNPAKLGRKWKIRQREALAETQQTLCWWHKASVYTYTYIHIYTYIYTYIYIYIHVCVCVYIYMCST